MGKITLPLIIGIILIVLVIVVAFVYYVLANPGYPKPALENPSANAVESEIIIEPIHVTYLLNELGAYNLRSTPLTGNNPVIEIRVGEDNFKSVVTRGVIETSKGFAENPDIKIFTLREEVAKAIVSGNIKDYMRGSISEGKTTIELATGYSTLFAKGYLSLYKELTGKSFTGSVVRIFGQG